MEYKKVLTHDGKFHADEMLAIAFLRVFGIITRKTPILRRSRNKISSEELKDPSILILDVGQNYDPKKGNFDHHQDELLKATNLLVLEYFCDNKKMIQKLSYGLFNYVSNIDRGILGKKGQSAGFNALISKFNIFDNGFTQALHVVESILKSFVRNADYSINAEKKWHEFERIEGGMVVVMKKNDPFVFDWKRFAAMEGIYFLINPNQNGDGSYILISRDSKNFPIPESNDQIFLHNAKFIAGYQTLGLVKKHVNEILKKIIHEKK